MRRRAADRRPRRTRPSGRGALPPRAAPCGWLAPCSTWLLALPHEVALLEDVLVDGVALRLWLLADPAMRLLQLVRVLLAKLVHLLAREQLPVLQLLLEPLE